MSLCIVALAAPASAAGIFPYPYRQETLPNGLRVILIPMPSSGLVSYWSVVRTGSRNEVEPGRSGYAHFFEHMMFRGTRKYPGPVYDRLVNRHGGRRQRLHLRRHDGLPSHFCQGGPAAGGRVGGRPLPEPALRPPGIRDRGGRGLWRVSQGRDAAGFPVGREASRRGLRTSTPTSTPPWASRPTSRPCPADTTTASPSSGVSTARKTWCSWWSATSSRGR